MGLGHSRSFLDHTQIHHTRQNFSGRVIETSKRPPPDKIQQSQMTHFHDRGGIRTLNPRNRAVAEPRFTHLTIAIGFPLLTYVEFHVPQCV